MDEARSPETAGEDEPSDSTVELLPLELPIEPGRPSLENVLFVLLGILLALGVVYRFFQLFG